MGNQVASVRTLSLKYCATVASPRRRNEGAPHTLPCSCRTRAAVKAASRVPRRRPQCSRVKTRATTSPTESSHTPSDGGASPLPRRWQQEYARKEAPGKYPVIPYPPHAVTVADDRQHAISSSPMTPMRFQGSEPFRGGGFCRCTAAEEAARPCPHKVPSSRDDTERNRRQFQLWNPRIHISARRSRCRQEQDAVRGARSVKLNPRVGFYAESHGGLCARRDKE